MSPSLNYSQASRVARRRHSLIATRRTDTLDPNEPKWRIVFEDHETQPLGLMLMIMLDVRNLAGTGAPLNSHDM